MTSPSPPISPLRQNSKNTVILALTTLATVAETAPIPGARIPALVLLELIRAFEVNTFL